MGTPLAFLPILLMLMGALVVGVVLLSLNALIGRKIRTKRKLSPF
jgi:NADH:ubiquinone oxidoreductase subunit 3 (subunit A)